VDSLGELLDDLRVEGRQVIGLAAGDQALVDVDLLGSKLARRPERLSVGNG